MKTGLFFGSFNPVHTGHMIIANYMATQTDLEEVWLIVSPHNPLKDKSSLANDYDRLHLVNLAIGENTRLKASDIEFHLPRPSYTIDTLVHLKEKFPQREFILIMGSDNLDTLHKWKNYEILLRDYNIYIYDRPGHTEGKYRDHSSVRIFPVPLMYLSATYIRQCIQSGKSIQYLVPDAVYHYLGNTNIYR
jgi:nicotinate-nucleotide adenylyltransferase